MADGADMHTRTVRIVNRRGLHARAAAKFVRLVEETGASVTVCKDDMQVCGTSIMGLLMLSAGKDSDVLLQATGDAGADALEKLAALIERRFDEDV